MKIIATICSKKKDDYSAPLPAERRYLGEHVRMASDKAISLGLPFYILSGKYGLISADTLILFYDKYLESNEAAHLTEVVRKQLSELDVTEIDFYVEDDPKWAPYTETMTAACALAHVSLHKKVLKRPQ